MANLKEYNDFVTKDDVLVKYLGYSKDVVIPDGVTGIHEYTFRDKNISSLVIPDSVTNIGYDTFYGCSSLTDVYYNGSIEDWCNIYFPSTAANPMSTAKNFYILDENNSYYRLTNLIIPNSVTTINNNTFYGFDCLSSVSIPDTVTSIGHFAFTHCHGLTSLVIPKGVLDIYSSAFDCCKSLTRITIPTNVRFIGTCAFYNCTNLTDVYYSGTIEDWCNIGFGSATSNPTTYGDNFYILDDNNSYYLLRNLELVISTNPSTVNPYTLYAYSGILSIVVPNYVCEVDTHPFEYCDRLYLFISSRIHAQKLNLRVAESKHIEIFYEGGEDEWNEKVEVDSSYKNILFNCTKEMYDEYRNA